ncbi:DUF1513 domain-containing protein [Filomicrobium sp.]|uniref:DUF1513 domain-containing protein n=1 Tax=Filomicrobium sp. TaxID=2024831 RepID=UPI002590E267|nr:DUF1513 domain-containing protein [Filomicrobium sp.]MCV0370126.1 DUF1513 domain-containing protein [Filomicrobium sp.]
MAIDRRAFVAGTAAMLALPRPLHAADGKAFHSGSAEFVSACKRGDGHYALAFVTADGKILREIPLDGRGHDVALSPDGTRGVAFARRPGRFAIAFDLKNETPPVAFDSPEDRHFYGHGVFSRDGRLLYVTENDFDAGRGVLGIYDVGANYRRIGEFDAHGVGPHEVILLEDGVTLAVANGGIDTHPASGREKLNLSTMQPSLVFINSRTGDLVTRQEIDPALHKLSIRHICADARGRVWFGGQWEDAIETAPELVGYTSRDEPIRFVSSAQHMGPALKGYIGSVSATNGGEIVSVSAPRAGRILHFDANRSELMGEVLLKDACGIAEASDKTVAISSGEGILEVAAPGKEPHSRISFNDIAFDNHMRRLRL